VERRRLFEAHYQCPIYDDIASAMESLQPDVVAVATPTAVHLATVSAVLQAGRPSAILCEKPLSYELKEAHALVAACEEQGCRLYVNYMRRSDPGVAEVKRRLTEGQISQPVKGVVWYSKGLFNNGSHFLNLLQHWLGKVTSIRVIESGRLWNNRDPEPDVMVSFDLGKVCFLAAREEDFSHYTIELIAQNGRLRYEQGGARILWQPTAMDMAYKGYKTLDSYEDVIPSDMDRIQWNVADQLVTDLEGHHARICSGAEAFQTLEVLSEIKDCL
jgi:predicted dehydrogenase